MAFRNVERIEVVINRFDLRPRLDGKAKPQKDVLNLPHHLSNGMNGTQRPAIARQRPIELGRSITGIGGASALPRHAAPEWNLLEKLLGVNGSRMPPQCIECAADGRL